MKISYVGEEVDDFSVTKLVPYIDVVRATLEVLILQGS